MTSLATFEVDQNTLITLSLTSRVACDLITTMALAWYLNKQRSSGFSRHATLLPNHFVLIILQDNEPSWPFDSVDYWWALCSSLQTFLTSIQSETGLIARYVEIRRSWRVKANAMLSLVAILVMSFVRDSSLFAQCQTYREIVPNSEAELWVNQDFYSLSRNDTFSDIWIGLFAILANGLCPNKTRNRHTYLVLPLPVNANSLLASWAVGFIWRRKFMLLQAERQINLPKYGKRKLTNENSE